MRNDEINMIRDIALDLEHDNPSLAIKLLEIAHAYRPDGAFILNKLNGLRRAGCLLPKITLGDCARDSGHAKNFDDLPESSAVMKIRSAGIGDMMSQCSAFFILAGYMNVTPYFTLPDVCSRNEILITQIFEMLGFYKSGLIVRSSNECVSMPLSAAADCILRSQKIKHRNFQFDMNCYGSESLKELRARSTAQLDTHIQIMTNILKQSDLYRAICNKRDSDNASGQKIALHVRLGDVAQIDMDFISHILRDPHPKGKILHARGIFDLNTIKSQLPSSNTNRFKSIKAYAAALDKLSQTHLDSHITLLSDGMTRVARHILKEHRDMMKNPKISHWQLENELNAWLKPLVERSDKCLIGEGGGLLVDTLIEGLSSDIIISGSPGLFEPLSRIMGLNNMFVNV